MRETVEQMPSASRPYHGLTVGPAPYVGLGPDVEVTDPDFAHVDRPAADRRGASVLGRSMPEFSAPGADQRNPEEKP
jgi:hypothetical protein